MSGKLGRAAIPTTTTTHNGDQRHDLIFRWVRRSAVRIGELFMTLPLRVKSVKELQVRVQTSAESQKSGFSNLYKGIGEMFGLPTRARLTRPPITITELERRRGPRGSKPRSRFVEIA